MVRIIGVSSVGFTSPCELMSRDLKDAPGPEPQLKFERYGKMPNGLRVATQLEPEKNAVEIGYRLKNYYVALRSFMLSTTRLNITTPVG